MLAAILVCGASMFTSCLNDTSDNPVTPVEPDLNVAEKIIGKWISADGDGLPVVTNEKLVLDFVSPTKAFVSASFSHHPASGMPWMNMLETDVAIDGNKMTLTTKYDQTTTAVNVYTITAINGKEFSATLKFSMQVNGNEVLSKTYPVRYVKVDADYSKAILGTWEGKVTSENDEYTDGELHRWEYKADGTYTYYVKNGDQWVASANTLNEYFVAGNLLCFRWVDNGVENREWWEITIQDGVMKWTALRKKADGTTYTATFEMTKVE